MDEAGLINLVNKYIRDRIENEQKHQRKEEAIPRPESLNLPNEPEVSEPAGEDQHEWQLLRILIEYGHEKYEGFDSVANLIETRVDTSLLQDSLVHKLFVEYMDHYQRFGKIPEMHYFINYPDQDIRNKMASLLHPRPDISQKWKEKFGIEAHSDTMMYVTDVDSTLSYFELKKILIIQDQLTAKLSKEKDPLTQSVMQQKFLELRQMEREILKKHNTVVFKSLKSK